MLVVLFVALVSRNATESHRLGLSFADLGLGVADEASQAVRIAADDPNIQLEVTLHNGLAM